MWGRWGAAKRRSRPGQNEMTTLKDRLEAIYKAELSYRAAMEKARQEELEAVTRAAFIKVFSLVPDEVRGNEAVRDGITFLCHFDNENNSIFFSVMGQCPRCLARVPSNLIATWSDMALTDIAEMVFDFKPGESHRCPGDRQADETTEVDVLKEIADYLGQMVYGGGASIIRT